MECIIYLVGIPREPFIDFPRSFPNIWHVYRRTNKHIMCNILKFINVGPNIRILSPSNNSRKSSDDVLVRSCRRAVSIIFDFVKKILAKNLKMRTEFRGAVKHSKHGGFFGYTFNELFRHRDSE